MVDMSQETSEPKMPSGDENSAPDLVEENSSTLESEVLRARERLSRRRSAGSATEGGAMTDFQNADKILSGSPLAKVWINHLKDLIQLSVLNQLKELKTFTEEQEKERNQVE
jgi:hypothetical protein